MVIDVTHFVIFSYHLSVSFYQVSCERYDPKALLKHWDNGFITMSGSFMAYGKTGDKAVNRALDGDSSAVENKAMRIAGCVCTAVARDGRPHVMSVSFPAMSGVPEQCFAFATSYERDSFMRALQAACSLKVAQVNLPLNAAPRLVSNAAARDP